MKATLLGLQLIGSDERLRDASGVVWAAAG
jgi:hypothetical protein